MRFIASFRVIAGLTTSLLLMISLQARERTTAERSAVNAENKHLGEWITPLDWGSFGSPVVGTSESTRPYAGAELFAGPRKFASSGDNDYYHGVLPNGRIVKPSGTSAQVGMNPLGIALTPDGKFAIVSNDDERNGKLTSLQNTKNRGGYSLTVLDTSATPMTVVSQINTAGKFFIGLQVAKNSEGGYKLYASGGGDNSIKLFNISTEGTISAGAPVAIEIQPILPATQGWVSNYSPAKSFQLLDTGSNPATGPTWENFGEGAKITFPAGSALSSDGKYLYVACNGDNSLAVIDVIANTVVARYPVGYFPYGILLSADGVHLAVSNWGITTYKFAAPAYDSDGKLIALRAADGKGREPNLPAGFFVPKTSKGGLFPKTSSVSLFLIPKDDPTKMRSVRAVDESKELDRLFQVGDTHPSAMAIVNSRGRQILYVARTNDSSLGLIDLRTGTPVKKMALPLIHLPFRADYTISGTYPNALVASHDGRRLYVAEGGINSVAVLDTTDPVTPKLVGRLPTGWWPSALTLSPDDKILYVVNAKGIGEDINPATASNTSLSTGVESFQDSNFVFGSIQKVVLSQVTLDSKTVTGYNMARLKELDDSVVPLGGKKPSKKIKCVIFIEQENKSFDSVLGSSAHFGPFASTSFNKADGSAVTDPQYNPVTQNTQMLANAFATAVNYYSDSEESDAGHQFCASGTATDYTEKTLLVKTGRGLLVNKNFEPEDYPASGYIFNNAARNNVSFKDYGELVRIDGTDTGTSLPTTIDDPLSGKMGYPLLPETNPVAQVPGSDVDSRTQGLGQAYFMSLPMLAVLGDENKNREPHLDTNYPGYNFNISDQRRALEFIRDFDRMVQKGTVPKFIYIYLPNDHTGKTNAPNFGVDEKTGKPIQPTAPQQVEDGDVAIGMVVQHLLQSPIYYDAKSDTGAAIFITYDDAQSTFDHIHPHRTPLILVSPFAKPSYMGRQHYATASIVKTEELLLGLPPNNLGDLLATDLRDLFQPKYNEIRLEPNQFNRIAHYESTPAGRDLWALVDKLDTVAPDEDSLRLGGLGRLSMRADQLYQQAERVGKLDSAEFREAQDKLMNAARMLVNSAAPDE